MPADPSPPPLPVSEPVSGPVIGLSCASCGGAKQFTPSTGGTTCVQCGTRYPIEADHPAIAGHPLTDSLADERSVRRASAQLDPAAVAPDEELVCPSCHGVVGFVGTLAATRCPFCAHAVQRSDLRTAPDRLPVDGIVPFGIDQAKAQAQVDAWIRKRRFAPRNFKTQSTTGSFAGIYLPFFTFDADTSTTYEGRRGENFTTGDGSKDRPFETETRWHDASGQVAIEFDDLTVTAESALDPAQMRDLEPWPTQGAVAFRPEYLAGFFARRYDRELAQCWESAREVMTRQIDEAIKDEIGGDSQEIVRFQTNWGEHRYRQLLLPVFLLVVSFRARPYRVLVNGATGEVHGKRPYSKAKLTVLALVLALSLVGGAFAAFKAWQSPSTTVPLGEFSTEIVQPEQGIRDPAERIEAAAAAATRECRRATLTYRAASPDTYFPDLAPCAGLDSASRLAIGTTLFADDEVDRTLAARRAARDASPREECEAAHAARYAVIAANRTQSPRTNPIDEPAVDVFCDRVSQQTSSQLEDQAPGEYAARERSALSDAP